MLGQRLNRIVARHGMPLYKSLAYELYLRAYRHSLGRGLLKCFSAKRQPAGWIFVVGCYNAGTTIVKDSIAAHPDITTPPLEGDVLTSHLPNFEENGWPRGMYGNAYAISQHRNQRQVNANAIISDWRPWIRPGKYFLEKSISNSVRIKIIREMFPQARFVCVVREPDEVVSGIQKRSNPQGLAKKILGHPDYPDNFLQRQWAYIYERVLEDIQDDLLLVSYEAFINNPVDTVQKLYKFLELPVVNIEFQDNELLISEVKIRIKPRANPRQTESNLRQMLETRINQINSNNIRAAQ